MPRIADALERESQDVDLEPGDFERLLGRRERKQRNERVRAGVLALAITIAVVWLGVSVIRSGSVPADPSPDLPSAPESWSHLLLETVLADEGPSFLAAGPDRLAAVGVQYDGPTTSWTSSDGATWTRARSEDLDGTSIEDITSGGTGFIATGSDGPTPGTGTPTIWTSDDGVSWNPLPDDPIYWDTLSISAVVTRGPGLVAVGSWMGAWYSSDGMTWERATVPPVPPGVYPGDDGQTPQVYLSALADRGDRLVATGIALLDDGGNLKHHVVVVWTSRDGRSWTDVPLPADVFPRDSSISEIAAGPEGFVAVGQVDDGQVSSAAIWYSPDGRDWRLQRPGPDGLVLESVAAGDGGYVAVGATMSCTKDCGSREAVAMTSVDGETWVRVPSGPDFRVAHPSDPKEAQGAEMSDVVAWGSRFAALGYFDGEPAVWLTSPGIQEDVPAPAPAPDESRPAPPAATSGTLAYSLDGDIYVADQDGSNAVRIANGVPEGECSGGSSGEYWAEGSMWSPDGRYLAYRYSDCADSGIDREVVISDTSGNVITRFPAQGWQVAWSPDSTRLAVWDSFYEAPSTIGIYGLDGVRLTQLTMPSGWQPSSDTDPVWMPSGIAVRVADVELPLDGSTPVDLARDPEGYSPDGTHVAYIDGRSLMVARSDGSEAREVYGGFTWAPTWSPTGEQIAFVRHDGDHYWAELVVVDVVTGSESVVVKAERGAQIGVTVIGFSPQGDRILFSKRPVGNPPLPWPSGLWSVGIDGSDPRLVVEGTGRGAWLSP